MNKHLPQSEVPYWARSVAQFAARESSEDLDLYVPRIQWVKTDRSDDRAGWVDRDLPDHIFLSLRWAEENGALQTAGLVLHENRHRWQAKHSKFTEHNECRKAENDANKFVFDQLGILMKLQMWWDGDDYDY